MASVASITLELHDRASADIERVARSLDRLDNTKTITLDGRGVSGVAQGFRSAEQSAARLTTTTGTRGVIAQTGDLSVVHLRYR